MSSQGILLEPFKVSFSKAPVLRKVDLSKIRVSQSRDGDSTASSRVPHGVSDLPRREGFAERDSWPRNGLFLSLSHIHKGNVSNSVSSQIGLFQGFRISVSLIHFSMTGSIMFRVDLHSWRKTSLWLTWVSLSQSNLLAFLIVVPVQLVCIIRI